MRSSYEEDEQANGCHTSHKFVLRKKSEAVVQRAISQSVIRSG